MPRGTETSLKGAKARKPQEAQRTGMIVAAGLGAVFVGVLGWYGLRALVAGGPGAGPAAPEGPRPRPATFGSNDPEALQVGEGRQIEIPLMDRKDLRRQVGLVTIEATEPLEGGHVAATKPQAWLYLEDGRTLHIAAPEGRLYMPDRGREPESGTLSGGVVARLYEARTDGTPIDPETDEPVLTFKAPTLAFDSLLWKVSTAERWDLKSDVVDATGMGLEALVNQVKQRLELCRIGAGDNSAVFHAARPRARKERPVAAGAPKPADQGAAPTTAVTTAGTSEATKPVETLYRVEFDDTVRLVQAERTLDADALRIWARLLDGKLPERAIAEVRAERLANRGEPEAPTVRSAPSAGGPSDLTDPVEIALTSPVPDEPDHLPPVPATAERGITLHWTGPCVVTPLEDAPAELTREHLAARFTAERSGVVRLADTQRGGSGRAAQIDYGATTGKLLLTGAGPGRPRLEFANAGAIETERIEGSLATGIVHIPSGGALTRAGRDSSIQWRDQADFGFRVRDGAITGELAQATFDGGVVATDRSATLLGDFARADFASAPGSANNLSRLVVKGHAFAHRDEDWLAGDTLDAEFALPAAGAPGRAGERDSRDPELRVVTLTGHAVAQRPGAELSAGFIEARLARDPQDRLELVSAAAQGAVRYFGENDDITATAEQMRADLGFEGGPRGGRRQIVDLIGPVVEIRKGDVATITGTQLRLDGVAQSLAVFGAGIFDYNDPGTALVHAGWTGGMTYADLTGELECWGDADAVSTPDALSRDRIEAERLTLGLTPRPAPGDAAGAPERRLLRADAIGSVLEREGGTNARVTSERFIADSAAPDGRRRGQLLYLEGPTIKTDNERETLDVPAAGKLVIVDRTDGEATDGPSLAGAPGGAGAKGDSLFTWLGTLHMERASGRAEMDRGVHLTHRGMADRQVTNMDCDHLIAVARTAAAGDGGALQSATATGAIYVTSGPEAMAGQPRALRKELVADRAEYDAVKGSLEASAIPGNLVSYFDPAKGAPVSADGLFWDLAKGRVELRNPRPVVVPRP